MSCGVLDQLTPEQLLTIFANNSGPTPNIYVSIHGGELPAGNVDSYNAKVAAINPGADMRDELTKIFVAVVPSDLIVVKFSIPFCNNAGDAEMEADLRYWWSSPLWPATTEGIGSGAAAANILLNTCTIYGPGQHLYNQWMVFDDPDYFNIFSLPHFDGGGLAPTAAGSGDPMLAGGGLGADGFTLKDWAKGAVTQAQRDDYPGNLHYRHFDMQELLNYLSPATRGSSVQHHIATGPHMDANFVQDVASTPSAPFRVVYFFSCAPRPDPQNWTPLADQLGSPLEEVTQNVFGGRQTMYQGGRRCFMEIRAKLQQIPRSLSRPEFKPWRVWCLRGGLNCAVVGMGGSAGGGGGGGGGGSDPLRDAFDHFNLYWAQIMQQGGQEEIYVQSTQPSQAGGPDSQVEPGAATQQQWSGGRRRKRRRKRRRTRQKHRRRRRRRRTRRKRRRKVMVGGASAAENDAAINNLSKQLDKNLATMSALQDEINRRWGYSDEGYYATGGHRPRTRNRKKRRAMVGGSKKSYSYDNAQKLSNMALQIEQNQILINNMQSQLDRAWNDPRYSISPHFLRAPATS